MRIIIYTTMQPNPRLVVIVNQSSPREILRTLTNQRSDIFHAHNHDDYLILQGAFAKLMQNANSLNVDNVDDLKEFIEYGICAIARNFGEGRPIHPGTMNIVAQAIQAYNAASPDQPFRFNTECQNVTPEGLAFLLDVVLPFVNSPNMAQFELHHRPWINEAHEAREAARRAAEEAPPAETRVIRTLAEFKRLGGEGNDLNCPICMDAFVEESGPSHARSGIRRSPIFMPVAVHKDASGKWRHPIHALCAEELRKCVVCREKVEYPKLSAKRRTSRRPKSDPLRSVKRSSVKRSAVKRSAVKRSSVKRSPRSLSIKRSPRSADF